MKFTMEENKRMEQLMKERQNIIPKKLYPKLYQYKYVPWVVVTELYELSVRKVCLMHGTNFLLNIPFGTGYIEVAEDFLLAVERADKVWKENTEDKYA